MAISHLLFYSLLSLSCYYLNNSFVDGARQDPNYHHLVKLKSLSQASTCSPSTKGRAHGMQIAQRYGPCSPLGQENSSPNSRQILVRDQSRVSSINSITSNNYNIDEFGIGTKLPISGSSIGAGNYVVTVGFGTPKRDFTLIFDSGSDITWIQCLPCPHCYAQQDPIFDPSTSSTFTNAPCTNAPKCNYSMNYHDKSYSRGYLGRDTLTLSSSDVIPNFCFGCGQDNNIRFGRAAGLLGVGQGELSLVSQSAGNLVKLFCYCLPTTDGTTGFLWFGVQALMSCQTDISIPLITPSDPDKSYLYFVKLVGITIGQKRLDISSYMASPPATILDSGTVISRLPRPVYVALQSAFRELMSQYPPATALSSLLDTCYNLEGYNNLTTPNMILHFEGSKDVNLDPSGVIWAEGNSHCLAFAGNSDTSELTIIGNHQQKGLNVLYKVDDRMVEFGTGGCHDS